MLSAYWPWWGDATDRQRDRHGCYMKSSLSSSSSLTRRRRSGLSAAWNRTPDGRWRERAVRARAGVTLKYLPHEKSARGEWVNHGIDSLPLLKNRHRPPKSLLGHYRIASPQEQSPPTDNLLAKTRPLFLPVNCRPGSLFWGEPIMGHLPAVLALVTDLATDTPLSPPYRPPARRFHATRRPTKRRRLRRRWSAYCQPDNTDTNRPRTRCHGDAFIKFWVRPSTNAVASYTAPRVNVNSSLQLTSQQRSSLYHCQYLAIKRCQVKKYAPKFCHNSHR